MTARSDVLIVGGGVIGLTLAYLLAKEDVSVTVVDKSDLGQEASWAGAGILPAGNPRRAKSPMGRLRAQAVSCFPEFSAELKSLTGIDNGYWKCGGLELGRTADGLEKKRLEQLALSEALSEQGEGLPCEILDPAGLLRLEPHLAASLPGGVFFPDVAQIRNPRHLKALIAAAGARGVVLLPNTGCEAIERDGERIIGIRTSAGILRAKQVVMAAGTWTTGLLTQFDWQPALKPIRGQIVLLRPSPPVLRHILLLGHQYLVPRQDGRVLVGSTEEDVGFDKNTTDSAGLALRELAARLVPPLGDAAVEKHWAGLRPGSADGRPYLGLVPATANLYVAAGHFRSGLQLSIITGMLMRDVLLGRPPAMDMTPFRPDRPITNPQPWIAHAL
jgi:glycine oxidase